MWIVCFSADSASVNTVPISLCVDCLFQCRQRQCEHSPYLSMCGLWIVYFSVSDRQPSVNTVPISLCVDCLFQCRQRQCEHSPYLSVDVCADSASVNTVPIVCFSADSASVNTVPISLCVDCLFQCRQRQCEHSPYLSMCGLFVSVQTAPV